MVAVALIAVGGLLLALWLFTHAPGAVRRDVIAAIDKVAAAARGKYGTCGRRRDGGYDADRGDDPDSPADESE
jgi:hypothetical protein